MDNAILFLIPLIILLFGSLWGIYHQNKVIGSVIFGMFGIVVLTFVARNSILYYFLTFLPMCYIYKEGVIAVVELFTERSPKIRQIAFLFVFYVVLFVVLFCVWLFVADLLRSLLLTLQNYVLGRLFV